MRSALLYIIAAAFLALIVSVAWWTREFVGPTPDPAAMQVTYTAQAGDTLDSVAESMKIPPADLAAANDLPATNAPLTPGTTLTVPVAESSYFATWGVHLAGLGAVIVGVLLSFTLARLTGVMPKRASRQILGVSLIIGLAAYSAAHAVGPNPAFTPQFVFTSLQIGFMWAAAFPMVARALGMKDQPPATAAAGGPSGANGTAEAQTPPAQTPPPEITGGSDEPPAA